MRLIDHLRGLGMSNRDARRALSSGKVYLSSTPTADPSRDVEPDEVSIRERAPRIRVGLDPAIVYRDEHLAVVLKPSGLLSVRAPGRHSERNLISEMSRSLGLALPVHRLDEPTSGLMLVARSEGAQAALKQLFFVHDIERTYLALTWGRFPEDAQRIENRLVRDRGDGLRGSGEGPEAKNATTDLCLIEHLGRSHSLVEARLSTGRTHQVRIHLSELGHPVVGDKLYDSRRRRSPGRLALHAHHLAFCHPMSGKELSFDAPLTDDLERLRRDLGRGGRRPGRRR